MKFIKKNIKFIILVLICITGSILSSYAIGSYLFNSNEVKYNNGESGIQSGDVQGAIDELYACASNYAAYNTRLTALEDYKNKIYPVGSIYISVNNINPGTLFGGTWVAFGSGKTIVGVDTNDTNYDTVEESHGNKSVTLVTNNLPSHSHSFTPSGSVSSSFTGSAVTSSANNRGHTHSVTAAGTVSQPTFTGTAVTSGANNRGHTHSVTAAGSVSQPTFTGTAVTSGTNSRGHTHNVKGSTGNQSQGHTHSIPALSGTAASNGAHTHGVTREGGGSYTITTNSAYSVSQWATGIDHTYSLRYINSGTWYGYSSSAGAHTHTVTTTASTTGGISANHTHSMDFTSGGESQNHTHSVTAAGTVSKPTFTGSAVTSGGESQNHTHSVTAAGTVSQPTFTGSAVTSGGESQNHTHSVTAAGTVSSSFTGTAGTTGNTGGGTAFSTVDPYITVYMWKRIA